MTTAHALHVKGIRNGVLDPDDPVFFDDQALDGALSDAYDKAHAAVDLKSTKVDWHEVLDRLGGRQISRVGQKLGHLPGLSLVIDYLHLTGSSSAEQRVVDYLADLILRQAHTIDHLHLVAHSWGTVLVWKALYKLIRSGELEAKRALIFLHLLAPACDGVLYGLISAPVSNAIRDVVSPYIDLTTGHRYHLDPFSRSMAHESHGHFRVDRPRAKNAVTLFHSNFREGAEHVGYTFGEWLSSHQARQSSTAAA